MHPPAQIIDPFLRHAWSGMSDDSRAILLEAFQAPGMGSSTASGSQAYGGPAIEPAAAGSRNCAPHMHTANVMLCKMAHGPFSSWMAIVRTRRLASKSLSWAWGTPTEA
ncbi:hypothetical protein OH77DRAFT_1432317 [Trametes cingulata]|nr:hypothetical protein OH77DRAFT_1432317 [Trametes cingulata]